MPETSQFAPEASYHHDEISLLDIAVTVARKRSLVVLSVLVFGIVGLVMAFSASPEYRSSMTVMSELGGDRASGGGLGSTLRSFGFSLPGGGSGGTLSAQAIPNIVGSRQVRLAVARDTFYLSELGENATLVDYLSRKSFGIGTVVGFVKSWTIGLPGKLLGLFRSSPETEGGEDSPFLTQAEWGALNWLAGAVSTSEDINSGLITIAATTDDPLLASQLVESVAAELRARVQEVYTNKTRRNLDFVQSQFETARVELREADRLLAEFQDSNQGLNSSRLQLEGQRLQRDVTFKSQLYGELQAQLTQAQIELQKSEPVITTIEEAAPPLGPSGPNRKLTMLLALILGGMVGIGLAFVSAALENGERDPEDRAKLAEIKAAMPSLPRFLRRG